MNVCPSRPPAAPCGRLRARRRRLLAGAAIGATLSVATAHEAAQAQAFRATPVTASGNVAYDRGTAGVETVTVNSPTAIIDWRPFNPPQPNPYPFLPAGNVATFNSPGGDYVVLNRVFVTDPIRFDGTVISRIGLAPDAPVGGTILFSSPGGIIVGGSALFDVGSLVLTSLNVVESSPGTFVTPAGGFVLGGTFVGTFQPNAGIVVEPGAQIRALNEGSYVALVAPRVVQGGDVRVNGSAAYIGADAVEFSVDQGLFDIVVSTGSDNANPVVHTGSTGGPASTNAPGDNHRIYAVSVARNQAITLLLQGAMGYDAAAVVGVDNGVIVLSAGHNISGGDIDPAPAPGPLASIAISDAAFSSETVGRATGTISATATAADPVTFADDVRLTAAGALSFAGANIPVGQNLSLAGATIDVDSVTAGGSIDTNSAGATTIDNAGSGVGLLVTAGGPADLGILDAGGGIRVTAASVALDDGEAVDDIRLDATGDVTVLAARAGDDFQATAGGAFTGGTIVATGLGDDTEDVATPQQGFNVLIDAAGDLRLDNGSAPGRMELSSSNGSVLSNGLVDAGGDLLVNAAVDATMNRATSGGSISILADGVVDIASLQAVDNVLVDPVSVTIGSIVAGGDISLDATTFILVGSADAGDDFTATAGTFFTAGTLIARGLKDNEGGVGPLGGGNIFVDTSDDLRVDNGDAADDIRLNAKVGSIFSATLLRAGSDINANALGDIDITGGNAGERIDLIAGVSLDADNLLAGTDLAASSGTSTVIGIGTSGGSATVVAGGPATLGTLQAGVDLAVDASAITLASGTAGRDVSLDAAGDIGVTLAQAGDDFGATAGGAFSGGTVAATGLAADNEGGSGSFGGSAIVVDSSGDLRLDDGTAPTRIQLDSATASILSAGTLRSGLLAANAALDLLLNDVFVVTALNLTTVNGDIAGNLFDSDGNIALNASGSVTLALADSGGSISVVAGGPANLGTFVALGDIAATASAIDFVSATAGRDVMLGAAGNIGLGNAQAGDDFVASAGGSFTGGTVRVTGTGADSEAGAGPLAGSNIVIDSTGDLRLDNGSGPGLIDLASGGGSILSNGTLDANRLTADAASDIRLRNVNVISDLGLAAPGGAIAGNRFTSTGDIDLDAATTITLASASAGGAIEADSGGELRLDIATAGGDIDLASTAGSVLSGIAGSDTVGSLTAGGDILADAGVDVLVGDLQAGSDVDLDAARNVSVRNAAGGATVQVVAGANADFRGAVAAPAISARSANIAIGTAGGLGNAGTQTVTLTVQPTTQPTVLGGTSDGPGYTLTDAEAGRIRAATVTIQAGATGTAANRAPDLLVRDLSLAGVSVGTFQVTTPGILQVEGNLQLAGVRPDGGIRMTATERLQIVNPVGSVRVRDATGLADGTLLLVSNNIWSAPQALLDQLRTDSNFAGRDDALLANNGPVEPSGYIEAGDVVLSARDSLFVQNSGTLASFAGITVRENTLRIVPTGTQPLRVFAFGRRINPDGTAVTNNAFFNEVIYQGRGGPVGYTDDAQFNLCFINTGICRLPAPDNNLPGGPDIIERPLDVSFTVRLPGSTDDLVDTSFADEPLIEEPVTSGGDSILWDCDNDDDGDCDEDDYDG